MPELPEVETIARTLAPQIIGAHINTVEILHQKSLQAGEALLPLVSNAKIVSVFRRAKLLLVGLSPAQKELFNAQTIDPYLPKDTFLFLAFHLKMTGRFFVHPAKTTPLKHTRIVFDITSPSSPLYSHTEGRLFFDDIRTFGYCRILQPTDFAQWKFWVKLGPEPLLSSKKELALRLKEKKMTIKGALLDQHVIAGVGNIYADESLFRAGISPMTRACDISLHKLEKLVHSLILILQQAIKECGSSIRDYRDAQGNAGAFQNNFYVYGRKGELCKECGTSLCATKVAGRGTVYCQQCQK